MRIRSTAFVVFSAILLFFLAGWAVTSGPFGYYYPTEETKSDFIRKYTPEHMQEVMKPFLSRSEEVQSSYGAGAGKDFVTNDRTIEPYVAVQPEMMTQLMGALRDDLSAQLTHDGAKRISETGAYPDRIRITYRLGQNIGSAVLSSWVTNSRASHYDRTGAMVEPPEGTEYMIASIAISEKWFPKQEKALQASLKDP
jgi:hypothetical protein